MKKLILIAALALLSFALKAQQQVKFDGFTAEFNEAEKLDKSKKTQIIVYALPNGNTINWTRGRKMEPGMDWHFDIQHIDAQLEFIRNGNPDVNYITVYAMADKKSFPAWGRETHDPKGEVLKFIGFLRDKYKDYKPSISLNCHSGGGSFIFRIIDAYHEIPQYIERISFLDAVYNYNDSLHTEKLAKWIKKGGVFHVTSYRDDTVVLNGSHIVSPTGGTGYRSELMAENLKKHMKLVYSSDSEFERWFDKKDRVFIYVKRNPEGRIYHTTLVQRNGFINSMLCGTKQFGKGYEFWSEKMAYTQYIKTAPDFVNNCRTTTAEFRRQAEKLSRDAYDSLVYRMFETGCTPGFMDGWERIDCEISDSTGKEIKAHYFVKPDFLSVGTDDDFLRVPIQPKTAQRIANRLGAFLSTSKISDDIYSAAAVKLEPRPLTENRDSSATFFHHNDIIEQQRQGRKGLIAGHKKDVTLSSKILADKRPDRLALYGWHKPDGVPIQNTYVGHVDWYVDYSHGFRLVRRDIWVDGVKMDYLEVLADRRIAPILNNEPPASFTAYPTKE